ncbi:hypothetical protein J2046_002363 [Rhizobium petrolearium]|nr:hypothetical protein [Neorhizobium petrolearium]
MIEHSGRADAIGDVVRFRQFRSMQEERFPNTMNVHEGCLFKDPAKHSSASEAKEPLNPVCVREDMPVDFGEAWYALPDLHHLRVYRCVPIGDDVDIEAHGPLRSGDAHRDCLQTAVFGVDRRDYVHDLHRKNCR